MCLIRDRNYPLSPLHLEGVHILFVLSSKCGSTYPSFHKCLVSAQYMSYHTCARNWGYGVEWKRHGPWFLETRLTGRQMLRNRCRNHHLSSTVTESQEGMWSEEWEKRAWGWGLLKAGSTGPTCTACSPSARHCSKHSVDEFCPEGAQPCNTKNSDIYWRRYTVRRTLYTGQWCPSPLHSRHLGASHNSPNRHQLPHPIFLNLVDDLKSLTF